MIFLAACSGTSDKEVPESGIESVYTYIEGGSGKASVEEETTMKTENGQSIVTVTWSSPNYDYMIVDGEKYLPVNSEGNSVFEIPVLAMEEGFAVTADTVAMSTPHEIEYTLYVTRTQRSTEDDSDNAVQNKTDNSELESWISKNLKNENSIELEYASKFTVREYDDDIKIVVINGTDYFIVAPENSDIVKDIPENITVINNELSSIYMVSSGSMDFFRATDSLDLVKYCSLKENDWYLDEVKDNLEKGAMIYAGKYSAPDYELLLSHGCDLVIENNMINHTPAVLEQLKNLGLPVMIDYSSYESSILGRMEWVKLYGILTGHLSEAEKAFEKQKNQIEDMSLSSDEKLTVGFFAVTSSGTVTIRKTEDYITNMIDLAGGEYGFESIAGSGTGTATVQMEAFYEAAKDCDILIYNSTIEGEINSKSELEEKVPLIKKCKAYKNGNIYCTKASFYQSVMELGQMTLEINNILNNKDEISYLEKIQ